MLKEKLSEIRRAESAAADIVDGAHQRTRAHLTETEARGIQIISEAVDRAEAEADEKDEIVRAEIESGLAQVDRERLEEIDGLRTMASAKAPQAVSLILSRVTDGLLD